MNEISYVVVFPSIFSKNKIPQLIKNIKKILKIKNQKYSSVKRDGDIILVNANDPVFASSAINLLFGIEKITIARQVKNDFQNIISEITSIGGNLLLKGEKFLVRVEGISKGFLVKDIEIAATSSIIEKKSDLDSLEDFLPGILKTTTLGYDGKGQHPIHSMDELNSLNIDFSKGYILEKLVKLKKEISIIITRFENQKYEIYEPIENTHQDQILRNSKIPADIDNKIFDVDPFVSIDQNGVGELVEIASSRGRKTNKNIKLGICGEHGGDPKSIEFCSRTGLNYVSCSPFRVPIARLAAAQAELSKKN